VTSPANITQAPVYFIALCAATQDCLPAADDHLWLFDDRQESVYQHYHSEIRRHIAAGGIIARLEAEIEELKNQSAPAAAPRQPWWRRVLGKS
jgi:hypothetical protein